MCKGPGGLVSAMQIVKDPQYRVFMEWGKRNLEVFFPDDEEDPVMIKYYLLKKRLNFTTDEFYKLPIEERDLLFKWELELIRKENEKNDS